MIGWDVVAFFALSVIWDGVRRHFASKGVPADDIRKVMAEVSELGVALNDVKKRVNGQEFKGIKRR